MTYQEAIEEIVKEWIESDNNEQENAGSLVGQDNNEH